MGRRSKGNSNNTQKKWRMSRHQRDYEDIKCYTNTSFELLLTKYFHGDCIHHRNIDSEGLEERHDSSKVIKACDICNHISFLESIILKYKL